MDYTHPYVRSHFLKIIIIIYNSIVDTCVHFSFIFFNSSWKKVIENVLANMYNVILNELKVWQITVKKIWERFTCRKNCGISSEIKLNAITEIILKQFHAM